jgi:rhamnopyranosyl-N-acetylglucosaminyl-diphospho-decaprenol beta-1,3/1,4-galactofuranosyltransferase
MYKNLERDSNTVTAVVVTFRRDELLKRCLDHLKFQTKKLAFVIVVDNAQSEITKTTVLEYGFIYIPGSPHLGGAGGYKLGMENALATEPEYIWLLDDDGYPDLDCLQSQLNFSDSHGLMISSPLCVDQSDLTQTSNPYIIGFKKISKVSFLSKLPLRIGVLQLFNGLLLSSATVKSLGYPNQDLFIRGDELDYYYRIKKSKFTHGLVTSARYFHPSGKSEYPNSRNSLLGVIIPTDDKKKYYQFRNQGFLVRKHRLLLKALIDWSRYSIYFLVYPGRDWRAFRNWAGLWFTGFTLNLDPYPEDSK